MLSRTLTSTLRRSSVAALLCVMTLLGARPLGAQSTACTHTVLADVVALDQPFFWNRLGAMQPQGMMFALRRDVVSKDGSPTLTAGNVKLREGKRPRPLVLRVNVGDCLQISFQNLLTNFTAASRPSSQVVDPASGLVQDFGEQPATRNTSVHVIGMQLVGGIASDGSNVGKNTSSLVAPGGRTVYTLYAEREGGFLMYGAGATTGGEGDGGSIPAGLFGAVNVEPRGAEWYRSEVTRQDMVLATTATTDGGTPETTGLPILNYDALYPAGHAQEGLPVLSMTMKGGGACHPSTEDGCEIVHSDLTAIITGTGRHFWGDATNAVECEAAVKGFPRNTILRNRCEPFREYTIIFHDEIGAVQAFPAAFNDPVLSYTLHGVVDGFAINYGTGGIGSEILANRLAVGPMWNCPECKYEEFFLTAWAVGDAAQVVDIPANVADATGTLITGPKATKVLYPDDPSNVYHSYIGDHVKFRNIHAGPKEHHVFHLHSHQWVTTGDSDNSSYLDSQAIGPGASYTYEITYDGSGNRNHTPGDAIFHCHFYPHFAQGMWAMWRNHDVFEWGTQLDANGVPLAGNLWETRALPDGEIPTGSPTPGLVPLPGKPMAPMPTATMPGYPYYIPGVPGHRPPQPALDFAKDGSGHDIDGGLPRHVVVNSEADAADLLAGRVAQTPAAGAVALTTGNITGPGNSPWKFIASTSGRSEFPATNRLDFSKESKELNAVALPEAGTPLEVNAMAYHTQRTHSTFVQPRSGAAADATAADFITNGRPPVQGAPYADPCVDDAGAPLGVPILYKGAAFQLDAKYTKTGWHHFQHRMLGLDEDIGSFMTGAKPPEPFFIRANTNHCITYWLTNLLPKNYEMDDFQVRTPTDVMGQHIHLVKFDVTSSDGSGNGYNYEDGSLSPEEVRERIDAINARTGIITDEAGDRTSLVAKDHPFFKNVAAVKSNSWGDLALGAQSTVQRWYSDETEDRRGRDRTLRTVFTHDHFAPSTQQQAGYYAGLVIEPKDSKWKDNATGVALNTRQDGGPTSWQAVIDLTNSTDCGTLCGKPAEDWGQKPTADWAKTRSYREFMLEFQDMQLAYNKNMTVSGTNSPKPEERTITDAVSGVTTTGYFDPNPGRPWVINPPARNEVPINPAVPGGLELTVPALQCPTTNGTFVAPPCPEAIAADDPGTMTVNYRAEPLALRVADRDPSQPGSPVQAAGDAGDLGKAFRSDVTRAIPELNSQPGFYRPLNPGVLPRDPFTPLLRTFSNDRVQIRMLVGAHEEGHNFSMHGLNWLFEPSWGNSGYRNSQMNGISEHFEFDVGQAAPVKGGTPFEDFLYTPGSANDDLWNGTWGLLRVYSNPTYAPDLPKLPNNPKGTTPPVANPTEFAGVCSKTAPQKKFDLVAVLARDVLPGGAVVYNTGPGGRDVLKDPSAILYVQKSDIGSNGKLKAGVPVEPLVLRVNAGDCVFVTLSSKVTNPPDTPGYSTYPMIVNHFNANQVAPSSQVGLHASLLEYDMFDSDGMNVGMNPVQTTVAGGLPVTYKWYAGDVTICLDRFSYEEHPECFLADKVTRKKEGTRVAVPMEYGAVPLMPADPIEQPGKGAVGALVVEPAGASCKPDAGHRTSATCNLPDGSKFRDLAVVFQDAVNLQRVPSGGTAQPVKNTAAAEDPEDSGQKGLNYRTEPFWQRLRYEPDCPLNGGHAGTTCGNGVTATNDIDYTKVLSNSLVGGDPQTPVFTADPGTPVRFRVVHPGGHARNHVFQLHGHIWQQLPWMERSAKIGENRQVSDPVAGTVNPTGKWLSEWKGSQEGIGPSSHLNIVPQNGAGGKDKVTGDYLFRDQSSFQFDGGIWGILRVCTGGDTGSCTP